MPHVNFSRLLAVLDVAAESVETLLAGAHAAHPILQARWEHHVPTSECDELCDRNSVPISVTQLIGVLRRAVTSEDVELLSSLSLVAESLSRSRYHQDAVIAFDELPTEYDAYVWHDASDDWCFIIPELDIEQRHHLRPGALAWSADAAATLATGAPAVVSLILGPSTHAAVPAANGGHQYHELTEGERIA